MIQVRNAVLSFGKQTIFDNISCNFSSDQHIGVVGPNGAGKSTLLKVIDGLIKLDEGKIDIQNGKTIAYMPQELVLESSKPVFDEAYTVFQKFLNLEKEKVKLEQMLSSNNEVDTELVERYSLVINDLLHYDKHQIERDINNILTGLGFDQELKNKPVDQLSLGWRMRLVLAKLLLLKADFYLFDEPTNHLDIVTQEWFFEFLKRSKFGFLLVSHDRYYLEKCCNYILEITGGKATEYTGNFSSYIEQKEQRAQILQSTYDRQSKEIEKKQATIDRFRAGTRSKMAQSMMKRLDKVELVEPASVLPKIRFKFEPVERSGSIPLKFDNLEQSFDNKLIFKNISGEIQRGEKVAIVAPNGAGKTTLFNVITGKYKSNDGKIVFGHNVKCAVFEQDQVASLKPNNTIIEEIFDSCPNVKESAIRSILGSFLFSDEDVYKKISVLSGGERNRVAMVKVLLEKANFLLLDEPTNHLDIYSKEVLLQALCQFDGTILFVSHDHDFLNKLSTRILELTKDKLYSYPGNFESYLTHKAQISNSLEEKNTNSKQDSQDSKLINNKELYNLKKDLTTTENKIKKLEQEIEKINFEFLDLTYGTRYYDLNTEKLKKVQKDLENNLKMWEEIQSKISMLDK